MQFLLTGFTPDKAFRVFTFDGVGSDRVRVVFTVKTDLSLIQRYGIRVQELPLLCRGLLERGEYGGTERALTFSEAEMILHQTHCVADRDAAQKKKSTRKPMPHQVATTGWHALGAMSNPIAPELFSKQDLD